MQNLDFVKSINNNRALNRGINQSLKRNPYYRQNSDFHRNSTESTSPKKIFSVFYIVILFLFIGFSAGILSGLYLAKSNVAVQKMISSNNTSSQMSPGNRKNIQGIVSLNNTSPGSKKQIQTKLQEVENNFKSKAKTGNENIIEIKKYLIYTGKFKKGIAYRLGYHLKEKNIPAFLVKTKKYTKLYVGSFSSLEMTKQILKKIKKISPEYFQDAIIKVHSKSSITQ